MLKVINHDDINVSIITPSYLSEKYIEEAILSVIRQSYTGWEMIIIDDASSDNSNEIIEKYCTLDKRISLIKLKENSGPAIARNIGIERAKGRYIAFLDADDTWVPYKLEKQLMFMRENKLAFSYSSYHLMDESSNINGLFETEETISYNGLLKTCSVGCLTAIYDTQLIGKQYMPPIIKRQDYGLWLKILKEIGTTKGMLEPLASYRILKSSVSSNKLKAAWYQWCIYRDIEKLNILKAVYYFIHYAYNGIRKYQQ